MPVEGWLHTPVAPEMMTTTKTRVDSNQTVTNQQPEHEEMLIEEKGNVGSPPKCPKYEL